MIYRIRYVIETAVEADSINDALEAGREKLGPMQGVDVTEVSVKRFLPPPPGKPKETP